MPNDRTVRDPEAIYDLAGVRLDLVTDARRRQVMLERQIVAVHQELVETDCLLRDLLEELQRAGVIEVTGVERAEH